MAFLSRPSSWIDKGVFLVQSNASSLDYTLYCGGVAFGYLVNVYLFLVDRYQLECDCVSHYVSMSVLSSTFVIRFSFVSSRG